MKKEVTVRIEEKEGFTCIGKRLRTGGKNDRFFDDIASFEEENEKNGFFDALASLAGNRDHYDFCDWSQYNQEEEEEFRFDIVHTIMRPQGEIPAELELEEIRVPAHEWVVFSVHGAVRNERNDAMGALNEYAENWLQNSDYARALDYEIDHFPEGNKLSDDYLLTKWIPIGKKG